MNWAKSYVLQAQQQVATFTPPQEPPVNWQTKAVRKWLRLTVVQPGVHVSALWECAFLRCDRAASKYFNRKLGK